MLRFPVFSMTAATSSTTFREGHQEMSELQVNCKVTREENPLNPRLGRIFDETWKRYYLLLYFFFFRNFESLVRDLGSSKCESQQKIHPDRVTGNYHQELRLFDSWIWPEESWATGIGFKRSQWYGGWLNGQDVESRWNQTTWGGFLTPQIWFLQHW